MLRINISQQYAKINLDIKDPQIELQTNMPQLEIHTEAAKVEISSGSGVLSIDQTPCRESLGLKTNGALTRAAAEEGKRIAFETIGRMSEEGDRMMRIESHEDAVVNIATEKNIPEPVDVEWQSINPPIIEYRPTPVRYNPIPGKVETQLHWGRVESNFESGKVTVSMAQYGKVDIWVTGNMDMKV